MKLYWLRFKYGLEMTSAYLAQMMGEGDVANNHIKQAGKIADEYALELLNSQRGLFDQ